jgi:hypothetical protein
MSLGSSNHSACGFASARRMRRPLHIGFELCKSCVSMHELPLSA